jgi:hypothetical protein
MARLNGTLDQRRDQLGRASIRSALGAGANERTKEGEDRAH